MEKEPRPLPSITTPVPPAPVLPEPPVQSEPPVLTSRSAPEAAQGTADAAVAALRHSLDRYRSLVKATAQIVWTNSPDGEMMGEQPGWGAFTGQSLDQYQGLGWAEALHPEDRAATIRQWQAAVASRSIFEMQHRLRRADGVYRHFAVRAVAVLDEAGQIREWVGIHTDISEQHETLERLQASEARYSALAEAIPVQVWTARPDGSLDYVNPFACSYFGWSFEQLSGDGWQKAVHPADLSATLRTWQHALATGQTYNVEFRLLRGAGGAYRWHTGQAVAVRDKRGEITKWIGTNTDIDDQRRHAEVKEAALHQVQTERQRLLQMFMQAPLVMALYQGPDYKISMVNALWEEFTGKHNVLHKTMREVFPELEGQGLLTILDQVYTTRQVFQAQQMRILLDRAGDGTLEETFWDVVVQPLSEKHEQHTDLLTYGMEVTQQVRAQQEIERLRSQLGAAAS